MELRQENTRILAQQKKAGNILPGTNRGQTKVYARLHRNFPHRSHRMPRRARLALPNVPLHLIQRDNNHQGSFFTDEDYRL